MGLKEKLTAVGKVMSICINKKGFIKNKMKKLLLLLLFIPIVFIGQEVELTALRLSNNFSKPNRVLKTTISDKSLFQQKYNNTNLTLEYVIRYHFYTSIDLNAEENQLISMDGTKFSLSSKNALDLTDEVISLVSSMSFGKKEYNDFKKIIIKQVITDSLSKN